MDEGKLKFGEEGTEGYDARKLAMLILRAPWIEVVKLSGEDESNDDNEVISHQTVIEELLQSGILDKGTLTWDSLITTV